MAVANYIVLTVYISSTKGNTKGRSNIFKLYIHARKHVFADLIKSIKQCAFISYMEYNFNIVVNYPAKVKSKKKKQ